MAKYVNTGWYRDDAYLTTEARAEYVKANDKVPVMKFSVTNPRDWQDDTPDTYIVSLGRERVRELVKELTDWLNREIEA